MIATSIPTSTRRGRPGSHTGPYELYVPTSADVERLCAAFNNGATGDRNRALIAVLYRAGLRIGEAVGSPGRAESATSPAREPKPGLRLRDYNPKTRAITVRAETTKRTRKALGSDRLVGEARVVRIDPTGAAALDRWIDRRRALGIDDSAPLFCQLSGSRWTPQAAAEAINYAVRKAGLDGRFNAHAFRHAHAVRLVEATGNASIAQRALGHSSVAVTETYLRGLDVNQAYATAIDSAAF